MLVSGGREPFWDGSDIRAIKNTLKKEVAINFVIKGQSGDLCIVLQVSFSHPEFSGVSAEARDFIKSTIPHQ